MPPRPRSPRRPSAPRRQPAERTSGTSTAKAAGTTGKRAARTARAPRTTKAQGRRRPRRPTEGGRVWRWRRWLFVPALAGFAVISGGLFWLSRIPLPNPKPLTQTSFVYAANGQVLATFSRQNRVNVSLARVPKVVIDAVVSTEDRHFFTEGALDPVSIVRAFLSDLGGSGALQGASTITQQYVKQAYLNSQRTLTRKIKEAAIAIRLARAESKDQILQSYLNTIYWGRGAYGVEAASEAYFGQDVSKLGLAQASLLAGLIREPTAADPATDPQLARGNQADTLRAMIRDKEITSAQAARVEATSFSRYVRSPSSSGGLVSDVPGAAYFISAVQQELIAKYGQSMVDGGGLRVTTTLDPTLQAEAFNSVYGSRPNALDPANGTPSGALVSLDDSGEVKAMVGGPGYSASVPGSTVNLSLGAEGGGSGRQAGSTFKAFMLADLIDQGYSVDSVFPAPPEVVLPQGNADGTPWAVTNFEHEVVPPTMSLVEATALSVNTVYAQVVDRLGASSLDSTAENLGIRHSELPGAYPSQVLGTADVSPLEMAAAYATFAAGGVYHTPILISRVTLANGSPVPLPVAPAARTVMTPQQAAVEDYVLQQVVLGGTGVAAGGVGSAVAGKTGTTNNSADAWFIGYTPSLTTAFWMGYSRAELPMGNVQGGTVPAEIWHDYMASALTSEPQYQGSFPPVYYLGGLVLTPPPPGSLQFPEGMGTTTTTSTTTTTVPKKKPAPTTTTVPKSASTTSPTATTSTTRPPSPSTTKPTTTTTKPAQ